jgi:hypothetical protein
VEVGCTVVGVEDQAKDDATGWLASPFKKGGQRHSLLGKPIVNVPIDRNLVHG